MSENITSRVSRLLTGSVNSMVDAMENMAPEMVMEQAIREVNQAITDIRSELGRVVAQQHVTSSRMNDENDRHKELTSKIEIALSEAREDLAEAAVAKLLDIESQIPVMEQSLSKSKGKQEELEGFIEALQARKREMQEELLSFRKASAESQNGDAANGSTTQTVEGAVSRAEDAFDRVMSSSIGVDRFGKKIDLTNAKQMAELDDLARKSKIQERLAAFKSTDK